MSWIIFITEGRLMENELILYTSPNTWVELRVLYESGDFPNLNVLHEQNKHKYSDMPDLREVVRRAAKECWDKDRMTEVKVEVKRRNLVELYAKLGMSDHMQAKYRIKCVKAIDKIEKIINRMYGVLNDMNPRSREFTETLGKIKVLSDSMFKGMNTSLAALQDISKLTGSYAPTTTKEAKSHNTKDGLKELEDMSEEEIIQDLKRMQRAGIDLNNIRELETLSDAQRGPNEP